MPWFKVDDGFHGHPKVMDLSLNAVGLWTLAGSWSAKYLTDGYVPAKTLRRLGAAESDATELEQAGLWLPVEEGWQFKDWSHYQPTKEEVEAERLAARDRMKKVRAAKKGVRSGEHPANLDGTSEEVRIAPSHPIPIPSPSSTKKGETAPRGTRLDPNWLPSKESVEQMANEAPDVDTRAEHRVFVDYWIAQPGQKGIKTNWESTWKNWMRRKQGDIRPAQVKQSKAAVNAAEYRRLFGESEGGMAALDAGLSP